MIDNKYIKHPYHCETCHSLTPHVPASRLDSETKAEAESEARQWKIGILIEYLMTLFFKDDKHASSFFIDQEAQYQCEKCGTKSWH
ncbi:hypothetical protein AB6D66_07780 [Vibrio pomeroyi]|uniref:Uncharacterized protein n=1 Tax=Vibrio pomeroyi TaxID=198832 RepID=A0ABV4MV68_9VIBR|nr:MULTISPECIES: hypothetical protein [unclassified Vibrio]UPR56523.1 hypothetical protein ITG10_15805 [Vibrio sp. ED004]UPR56588.1 hypothetical protein ITG10_16275 [Vibrio sp. ED004]